MLIKFLNMKKTALLSIFVLTIYSFLLSGEKVLATVGGPTYLSQIAYKASDKSLIYLENSSDGRGCPPIIHSISLSTLKDTQIKTCDEIFQQFSPNLNGEDKYLQFISDTYENLPYLSSVSLKKNNLNVRVEFLDEHVENGEKNWSEFHAVLTQDNKEVGTINFRGCSKDQPHIFEGYMIPNTDAMAVVISNKGDCFEGGYVRESLSIVKGIKYYNTDTVRGFKEKSATEPNIGNLVVYAASEDGTGNENNPTVDQKNSFVNILLPIVTFFVGAGAGYIIFKNKKETNQ